MSKVFLRKLKLDLVTDTSNPVIEWFNELWNRINNNEINVYHSNGGEFIYYIINGGKKQWIFYRDDKNDRFWCNEECYWTVIGRKFFFNYDSIQAVTKVLVDNALNIDSKYGGVSSNLSCYFGRLRKVENALLIGINHY